MQITVNREKIDYSLEDETNLFEVLSQLRGWLNQAGLVLQSAKADHREIDLSCEEGLRTTAIESVAELDVIVSPTSEVRFEGLSTLREFFSILRNGIDSKDSSAVRSVLREYPVVSENLEAILARNDISPTAVSSDELDSIIRTSGLIENGTIDDHDRLFELLGRLDEQLAERMREIADPAAELGAAAEHLRASTAEITEVSIMLQTGKDREAMDAVVRFAELSAKLIRLYPYLHFGEHEDLSKITVDGVTFEEFYVELNSVLSELIEAFSNTDSVLIGDLLEYEIAPRLEKLEGYVDLLLNR